MSATVKRIILVIAALMLATVYFFPLWEIALWAPQYPEGLSLYIWINKVGGELENVNLLNHYIGMKMITPEAIPELRIMPVIVGVLMAFGLLAAVINKKPVTATWVVLFTILAIVGLADFYKWEYDYGHNLSEDAPIKMEGMTYQPPLIGTKTLLNITVWSFPGLGGIALTVSLLLGYVVLFGDALMARFRKGAGKKAAVAMMAFSLGLSACTAKAQPIDFGRDHCDYCKMTISDPRFGGEIVAKTGKAFKFDSLDCLVSYQREAKDLDGRAYALDFLKRGELIDVEKASFVKSDQIQGTMNTHVLAVGSQSDALSLKDKFKGEILQWNGIVTAIK